MKLPKYLIEVTTFSKILAIILFIILPILGFKFGMGYQQKLAKVFDIVTVLPTPSSYVYPSPSAPSHDFQVIIPEFWTETEEKEAQKDWITYSGDDYSFLYPSDWHIFNCDTGYGVSILYASPQSSTSCSNIGYNTTAFNISQNNVGFNLLNDYKPDKTSKIVVDGVDGISGLRVEPHVQDLDQLLIPYLLEFVIIPHDKIYYEFTLKVYDDPDSNTVHTFHRILSTFKFKR